MTTGWRRAKLTLVTFSLASSILGTLGGGGRSGPNRKFIWNINQESKNTYILYQWSEILRSKVWHSPERKVQVQGKGPSPEERSRSKGKSRYGQVFRKVAKDAHQSLCLTQQCQELTEWQPEQEYDRGKGKMPETKWKVTARRKRQIQDLSVFLAASNQVSTL